MLAPNPAGGDAVDYRVEERKQTISFEVAPVGDVLMEIKGTRIIAIQTFQPSLRSQSSSQLLKMKVETEKKRKSVPSRDRRLLGGLGRKCIILWPFEYLVILSSLSYNPELLNFLKVLGFLYFWLEICMKIC